MKYATAIFTTLLLGLSYSLSTAQEKVTVIAPTTEAAEDLDLHAVSELFKDSKNLLEFEKSLNDPDVGINNLDLDNDGEVDYIRVVEEMADDTHVIILQVPLGEDEYQDVATIEVEKTGEDDYNMQVHGNEDIYGVDYYVAPTVVHIHTWPVMVWIYRPHRPYRSVYYYGRYPRWWRPYHPVTVNVYHTRTVRFTSRKTFVFSKTSRVTTVHKVHYRPHSSTKVVRKTTRVRKNGKTATVRTTKVKRKR